MHGIGIQSESCWRYQKIIVTAYGVLCISFIKTIIDIVLNGREANLSEDQLLPNYRNGKMEYVYWTFSFSAVNDDSGNPVGVFVTGLDTTDKVIGLKRLKESDTFSLTVLESSPDCLKIIDIEGRIQFMNTNGLCAMEIENFNYNFVG